jgi:hypothetical protein
LALVVLEHRLRRRQPEGLTAAPASAPRRAARSVQVLDRDPPELALEHRRRRFGSSETGTTRFSTRTRRPGRGAPARRRSRRRVDVAVEQAVQGDDGLVVGGGRVDEVDHQARLLAGLRRVTRPTAAGRPPRGGRREVHADRRARGVPALGEQHRVAEHVDLAALEAGQDLGELALRRLAETARALMPASWKALATLFACLTPAV